MTKMSRAGLLVASKQNWQIEHLFDALFKMHQKYFTLKKQINRFSTLQKGASQMDMIFGW